MNISRNELAAVTSRAKLRFPDHTLDDVYPVCVPIYELRLLVTTLVEDNLSTSARYVLRLINAGVTQPEEIGRMLGLPAKNVAGAASELLEKDLVVQGIDKGLRMTDAGNQCLQDGGSTLRPRNLTLRVPYDPLTKKVLDIDTEILLDREVIRKNGLFVIPVDPRPPRLNSIKVDEVRDSARGDTRFQGLRQILQVADIKAHKLRYMSDVVLVKMDARYPQTSTFAMYRALQHLEEESAEVQRLADLGRDMVPEESKKETSQPWISSRTISREEHALLSDIDELDRAVDEKDWETAEAKEARNFTQDARERAELESYIQSLEIERNSLQEKLAEREAQHNTLTDDATRLIRTEEHRPLLLEAIRKSNSELTLVSAWIDPFAFDDEVRQAIAEAILRGTSVRIAWGMGVRGKRRSDSARNKAKGEKGISELKKLFPRKKRDRLTVRLEETHEKFIICDDLFCAQGSFNWLSYKGQRDSGYRREASYYSERKSDIDLWKSHADSLFQ
ncbi:MAG: hypothetical protein OXL96_05520 [Candidatus Poribacteria bacterium]|nr:hypothetical protein [Candidatus Poribacteria bacterium]